MRTKSPATSSTQQKRNLTRITRSANAANLLLKQFTDHPSETYQLLLQVAGQLAFESALTPARKKAKLSNHTIIEFSKLLIGLRGAITAQKNNALRSVAKNGDNTVALQITRDVKTPSLSSGERVGVRADVASDLF